jgi:hypothetical protein
MDQEIVMWLNQSAPWHKKTVWRGSIKVRHDTKRERGMAQ